MFIVCKYNSVIVSAVGCLCVRRPGAQRQAKEDTEILACIPDPQSPPPDPQHTHTQTAKYNEIVQTNGGRGSEPICHRKQHQT